MKRMVQQMAQQMAQQMLLQCPVHFNIKTARKNVHCTISTSHRHGFSELQIRYKAVTAYTIDSNDVSKFNSVPQKSDVGSKAVRGVASCTLCNRRAS
jgi:hypothetical protein